VSLLRRAVGRDPERLSMDGYADLVNQMLYAGNVYPLTGMDVSQTLDGNKAEKIGRDFPSLATAGFAGNGVVFSCMLARASVFSAARLRWQRLRDGKPSDTFGTSGLSIFERPWQGGTTQDLLSRMIQDADLAGNSFWFRDGGEAVRLRPDWVEIAVEPRMRRRDDGRWAQVGWRLVGYAYTEGGPQSGAMTAAFDPWEVVHFAPTPDPLATFRGMSWLTPVIREIQADGVMTRHRRRFFENGATPNMLVKHPPGANVERVKQFARRMEAEHAGEMNAYKTLHLYPGADATVVGSDLRSVDFRQVQGAGETRIAAAAGVPPVIVGLSEGLQAATYSNYAQARRRFADGTIHPLWQNAAGSLEALATSPGDDVRLWYDASDVPFLREDEKDAAEIASTQANTINSLVTAGYTPTSAVAALEASDWRLLEHSGLYSVQLQPAGTLALPAPSMPTQGGDEQ
jgi:phage portal protein BeeE